MTGLHIVGGASSPVVSLCRLRIGTKKTGVAGIGIITTTTGITAIEISGTARRPSLPKMNDLSCGRGMRFSG
jgi:hypothetical protein